MRGFARPGSCSRCSALPAARFSSVESGEIVTFWAGENRESKLRKVLIRSPFDSGPGWASIPAASRLIKVARLRLIRLINPLAQDQTRGPHFTKHKIPDRRGELGLIQMVLGHNELVRVLRLSPAPTYKSPGNQPSWS